MKSNRQRSRRPITTERRGNRSDAPYEAASIYLESVAARGDIRAVALAAEDGLLVAGARGEYDLDGLAALGAASVRCYDDERVGALVDTLVEGEDLYASVLTIGEETFYLASVGRRIRSLKDASAALTRILAPTSP